MQQLLMQNQWIIFAIMAWSIPWKGIALWKSARNGHKIWFIILLLVNTIGILDIIYIFTFGRNKMELEKMEDFKQTDGSSAPTRKMI
jgi:hypothetical protein